MTRKKKQSEKQPELLAIKIDPIALKIHEAHLLLEELYASAGMDDYARACCIWADNGLARVTNDLDELESYLTKQQDVENVNE